MNYIVTELAGAEIAGKRNPGANKDIWLEEIQAEHPLRLQHVAIPPAKTEPGKTGKKS